MNREPCRRRQEGVSTDAKPLAPQRKTMKARDPILQVQPLTYKTKKQGQRGRNQYPERQFTINAISPAGELIDPPQIVPMFWNAIGAIIRPKMVLDPTIPSWPLVPKGRKEAMWQLLSRTFIVPRGTREQVKHYALKMLGETFRRWKSELNTRYVQKGRTPFADYGDITLA